MGALRFGQGSVSFSMSDDFSSLVRAALDRALPGVVERVESATQRVYQQAVDRAPVKTGAFRASISSELQVLPDLGRIRGRVFSNSPYGQYIKSNKLPGSGSAYVELLQKPMRSEAEQLIADVRDVLEREL